ncbi:MAG: TlpA family protein disulfide reductase [Bacteroidales bacterium]
MSKIKTLFQLLLVVAVVLLSSCDNTSSNNSGPATISGKWDRRDKVISLFKIEDGRTKEISNANLADDKSFAFAVPVKEEGFYVLGIVAPPRTLIRKAHMYTFYLKPGDQLNVEVNDSTYVLTGENSKENKALAEWHDFMFPLEHEYFYDRSGEKPKPSTYVNYYPLAEKKLEEVKSFKPSKTKNAKFDASFAKFRDYDIMRLLVGFHFDPRPAHPQSEEYMPFLKSIDVSKITSDASLLQYPYGSVLLNQLLMMDKFAKGERFNGEFLDIVKSDTLIGEMVVARSGLVKSYNEFLEYAETNNKYIITDSQKERMDKRKLELAQNNKEGQPAIDFKYPDINGKQVALSDLKGKVVVIDVWATWCGPCKKEIPHLKKLEEKYHGKDVAFVSVSVDDEKDKQKWADFVKKEGLTGFQLFAGGFKSDIAQNYKINAIPRFMVVDKDGLLVSSNSPRPSQPELKTLIDKLLK